MTAKADSSPSSQVSETQSSVWCPESGDDSKETSKKESSDAGESKTSAQTSASIFEVPEDFQDNGIFSSYYEDAYKQVVTMSLEEKIGQMIFAEMPSSEALAMEKNFHLGGSLREDQCYAPTNLIFYEAALWGCERGLKTLHLGGGVGSSDDNLMRFKRSFYRGDYNQFYIGRTVLNRDEYDRLCAMRTDDISSGYFPAYRA